MWVDPLGCCDSLVPSKLWIVQWSPCVSPPGHPQKTSPPKLTQPLLEVSAVTDLNVIRGWFCDTFVVAAQCSIQYTEFDDPWSAYFDNSKGIKWLIQKKTWISHWMDIAADHWKDQDQIRFHLRRKTRPWSSSIRPTHLILVTDNLLNLSLDFQTAPWSRCVWFWIRITGILLLQSTSTSAFIKPDLWLNTCGLEPKHLYLIVILLLRFVGQFSYISVQRRYHISWVSPTYPPAHNSAKITSRSQRHARPD